MTITTIQAEIDKTVYNKLCFLFNMEPTETGKRAVITTAKLNHQYPLQKKLQDCLDKGITIEY